MKHLVLVGRPDCHLCELLLEELRSLLPGQVQVLVLDIDQDDELQRRYWLRIPILLAEGEELSGYPLDQARLQTYLSG
jgi:hypothetical protein